MLATKIWDANASSIVNSNCQRLKSKDWIAGFIKEFEGKVVVIDRSKMNIACWENGNPTVRAVVAGALSASSMSNDVYWLREDSIVKELIDYFERRD